MWAKSLCAISRSGGLAVLLTIGALATAQAGEPASVTVQLGKQNGQMTVTMSTNKVAAGTVEFVVTNASHDLMHEFLLTPWKGNPAALPYDAKATQVVEDDLPHLQGLEDMPPGTKATLRLVLTPGSYVAFCDQPGHYKLGMFTTLTVTP